MGYVRAWAQVGLVLAGHDRRGFATVIGPSRQRDFADGLTAYLRAHLSARRALGLPRHPSPSPAGAGQRQISDGTVLVRVDLDD
jgi:hypothetical protein